MINQMNLDLLYVCFNDKSNNKVVFSLPEFSFHKCKIYFWIRKYVEDPFVFKFLQETRLN